MEKKRMKRKGEGEKGKNLDVLKKDLCLGLFLNYFGHAQELLSLSDQDNHFPRP